MRPPAGDLLVVIPARIGSTRFPGKVLARLGGLTV
ncbi:MAG: cytidylyltransferase domain-containing protein, partial [Pseudonocardia sp.]